MKYDSKRRKDHLTGSRPLFGQRGHRSSFGIAQLSAAFEGGGDHASRAENGFGEHCFFREKVSLKRVVTGWPVIPGERLFDDHMLSGFKTAMETGSWAYPGVKLSTTSILLILSFVIELI